METNAKRKSLNKIILISFASLMTLLILFVSLSEPDAQPETPPVFNSEWDGSVSQVEHYLKKNLNDPDSYESVHWGEVQFDTTINLYWVLHKYRAKNVLGGYVMEEQTFLIDSLGSVVEVR